MVLAWPAVGAVAEVGFCDAGLAAEVAWFGAEVAPGSCVRHAALRLPGPLGMARAGSAKQRSCVSVPEVPGAVDDKRAPEKAAFERGLRVLLMVTLLEKVCSRARNRHRTRRAHTRLN